MTRSKVTKIREFFLPQAVIFEYELLLPYFTVLFHLPSGILFTFHSQYTNLVNNALARCDSDSDSVNEQLLKRFTTLIVFSMWITQFALSTQRYLFDNL
jgi:hypothetical protein